MKVDSLHQECERFRIPLEEWLELCPQAEHFRPVMRGDITVGAKIARLEIPLVTEVVGSAHTHSLPLTIRSVSEYSGEAVCDSPDGPVVATIEELLAPVIVFRSHPVQRNHWRRIITGRAFLSPI